MDNNNSSVRPTTRGVILFTIYVNAIYARISHIKAFMFADDQTIAHWIKRNQHSGNEANINIDVSNFAKMWLLEISSDKCIYLQIDFNFTLNVCIDGHWL